MASELSERYSNANFSSVHAGLLLLATLFSFGCSSTAPTIAHVHIGHAITGHNGTPDNAGYFQLAESRAQDAASIVDRIDSSSPSSAIAKQQLAILWNTLDFDEEFAFNTLLQESANHIVYAANSDDASPNVRAGARQFETSMEGVLIRTDLIKLYIDEARSADSTSETNQYASEIQKLVRTNLNGEDLDGNGYIGDSPDEYGIRQLRRDLDAMIAAENPPYQTVDRWYLFNLIRLPSGDWIFRRSKSGASAGYQ